MNYLAVDLIGTNDHKIMNKLYFIPIVFFTLIFLPGLSAYAETDQLYVSLDSILNNNDHFGISVSQIGDLNNDGVVDIAVGAYKDDDGGQDRGALYIIFLNNDGTVKSFQKISSNNESSWLQNNDFFIYISFIIIIIFFILVSIKKIISKKSNS